MRHSCDRPTHADHVFIITARDPLGAAAAVAVVGLERYGMERLERVRRGLEGGLEGDAIFAESAPASLLISTRAAELLLGKSLESATMGDVGRAISGEIQIDDSVTTICCNLVGMIRGVSPSLTGEYVALGAHLDHLGLAPTPVDHDSARAANLARWKRRGLTSAAPEARDDPGIRVNVDSLRALRPARADSIFNGADDDGSGSVALLAIAEALSSDRPKLDRSVLLVWHTGEELGNQGSIWFTDHPTVPLDSVVAQLNLDMIGRGGAADIAGGGPHYLQVIGSRSISHELGDLIDRVNAESGAGLHIDYQFASPADPRDYYYRSDHASYARHCVPIAFFTTGEHADYHQVTDEPQYIDYAHLAAVTRFVYDVAMQLANAPTRPAIDSQRSDTKARCRQ